MDARDVQDGDITKEELGLALERLALALSATGLGVWERDIASNRVTWSDTMYRLFGRTREEFSGDPDEVLSFVHPDDRTEFRQGYMAALQDQHDFFEQEFRIVQQLNGGKPVSALGDNAAEHVRKLAEHGVVDLLPQG